MIFWMKFGSFCFITGYSDKMKWSQACMPNEWFSPLMFKVSSKTFQQFSNCDIPFVSSSVHTVCASEVFTVNTENVFLYLLCNDVIWYSSDIFGEQPVSQFFHTIAVGSACISVVTIIFLVCVSCHVDLD